MLQKIVPVLFVLTCAAFVLLPKLLPLSDQSQQGLPNMGYRDTIRLRVGYAGCGEFGGHQEMIKIYQKDVDYRKTGYEEMIRIKRPFLAEYWMDSIECSYKVGNRFSLHKRQQLTLSQEIIVLRYIQEFVPASLQLRKMDDYLYGSTYLVYLPGSENAPLVFRFSTVGKDIFQELCGKLFANSSSSHD